jgi:hypothetical protein
MTDSWTCRNCGGRMPAGVRFCGDCGLSTAVAWPGAPVGATLTPESGAPVWAATSSTRPLGLTILAVAEIVIAVVDLIVARAFYIWAGLDFGADAAATGILDAAFALVYVTGAVYAFTLAPLAWSGRRSAWQMANLLSIGMLAAIGVSILLWGISGTDPAGIVAHAAFLVYLNLPATRRLFGRRPLGA